MKIRRRGLFCAYLSVILFNAGCTADPSKERSGLPNTPGADEQTRLPEVANKPVPVVSDSILYLVEDDLHQWCAFRTETDWRNEVENLQANVVASIEYTKENKISLITITTQSESADWIVYDEYSLNSQGDIEGLNRTSNILPGDRTEEQMFLIEGKVAHEKRRSTLDLDTKKPKKGDFETWLPEVKIHTTLDGLPFSPLFKNGELFSKTKTCGSSL